MTQVVFLFPTSKTLIMREQEIYLLTLLIPIHYQFDMRSN